MFGNHIKPKDKMVVTYSREQLSAPLADLQWVINCIATGILDPDDTRSGRWRSAWQAEELLRQEQEGSHHEPSPSQHPDEIGDCSECWEQTECDALSQFI